MTKSKTDTIKSFQAAFTRKFGKSAVFNHYAADPDDKDTPESIQVSVPVDEIDWEDVEPGVQSLLKQSGASRYFAVGGAGLGFGFRDVSIYRK